MKIVILDLEWNTAYYRKEQRFLNEIIEFGAVKLDERLRVTDEFQMFVRAQVSQKLRGSVKQLTHISNEQLRQNGHSFAEVVKSFTRWAGHNALILTWSTTDLYTLMDNCRCFLGDSAIPFLQRYADLQKYVQTQLQWQGGNQLGLSAAAELLQVPSQDIDLHRAKGDSLLSARVLAKCYNKEKLLAMSSDARHPSFYERLCFKPFFVTDPQSPHIQPEDLTFDCLQCGTPLQRKRSFQKKSKGLESTFVCPHCQRCYVGHVQVYKLFDSVSVKRSLTQIEAPAPGHRRRRRRRSAKPKQATL